MTTTAGIVLLFIYAVSFFGLKLLFAPGRRPSWLAEGSLNAEYVMLAHIGLLIVGLSLLILGLIS